VKPTSALRMPAVTGRPRRSIYRTLLSHGPGHTVEVYRLRIEPGTVHQSVPHGPGVTEHLLVTAGRVRAGRPGEETAAGPGETVSWVSDVPHSYAALGSSAVESVLVIRSRAADTPGLAAGRGSAGEGWQGVQVRGDPPGAGPGGREQAR
jgi:quercetin dioxygenase-like cupin family protein